MAAFASNDEALRALAAAGADMNALEDQAYDVLTIAAVADDADLVSLALELGNRPDLITSPYEGTALIAAAHLGHHEVVRRLLRAGAPMDHVNNLGWTALMEAVVLGDGGPDYVGTVAALLDAGAIPYPGPEWPHADRTRTGPGLRGYCRTPQSRTVTAQALARIDSFGRRHRVEDDLPRRARRNGLRRRRRSVGTVTGTGTLASPQSGSSGGWDRVACDRGLPGAG